jgi:hypothetical protein
MYTVFRICSVFEEKRKVFAFWNKKSAQDFMLKDWREYVEGGFREDGFDEKEIDREFTYVMEDFAVFRTNNGDHTEWYLTAVTQKGE